MINELIEILLGAVLEFVPENYVEIVLAIATPIYVGILFVFTFVFLIWCANTAIKCFFRDR